MVSLKRSKGKSIIFNSNEYIVHFLVKTILCRKIIDAGHVAASEVVLHGLNGNKIVDCVDDTQKIAYEVERHATKEYIAKQKKFMQDNFQARSFVINLEEIPQEVIDSIMWLDNYLEGYIDK